MKLNFNFIVQKVITVARWNVLLVNSFFLLFLCSGALGQPERSSSSTSEPQIQDNSFMVEEAYNQEYGVVQHISSFTRLWNSKDWVYTFTQEWPVPGLRHQLSYTLAGQHAEAFGGSGVGDALINYRYQLIGSGETRVAMAPRLSLILPSGDSGQGRGLGGTGLQTNLPVSVVLSRQFVTHWNAGATYVPHVRDADRHKARAFGYSMGQSVIWTVRPRFNAMLETFFSNMQAVVGSERTEWSRSFFVNPGVRWAYNLKNGMQIVPGIAVPVGVGPSSGEMGILLYLSFEHPFRKIPGK